jgi:hypothetical protein
MTPEEELATAREEAAHWHAEAVRLLALCHRACNRGLGLENELAAALQREAELNQRIQHLEEEIRMARHVTPTPPPAAPAHGAPAHRSSVADWFHVHGAQLITVGAITLLALVVLIILGNRGSVTASDVATKADLNSAMGTMNNRLGLMSGRLDAVADAAAAKPVPAATKLDTTTVWFDGDRRQDFLFRLVDRCGVTSAIYKSWRDGNAFVMFKSEDEENRYLDQSCPASSASTRTAETAPAPVQTAQKGCGPGTFRVAEFGGICAPLPSSR